MHVISSAVQVRLTLNGRDLGPARQSDRFSFTFDAVAYEAGELKAVGYDARGRQVCEAVPATAGPAVALRLSAVPSPHGLRADGADLALVQVEAVDAAGRRNPVALDSVRFELTGPAEWRGGIAQGPGNHVLARTLPLEGGVNRVLVRSTTRAGKIVLRARADSLAPAELALTSTPVAVSGGLAALPPPPPLRLARGPTPSTPSFAASRVAVPVASGTAASNGERAALSVDDDETTSWANAPGAPAQITYRLARPALLRELVLKLTGWRERSYPLRVFIDGAEVYRGTTPKNLGYVTLPLAPREGSEVRIALDGQADDAGAIRMLEVANQANADTGAQQVARSQLSIIEAEFYELP